MPAWIFLDRRPSSTQGALGCHEVARFPEQIAKSLQRYSRDAISVWQRLIAEGLGPAEERLVIMEVK
jgi:hypothetical protein